MPQVEQRFRRKRAPGLPRTVQRGGRHPLHVNRLGAPRDDSAQLAAARAELKQQTKMHSEHTLPAVILSVTGRVIQSVRGCKSSTPPWLSGFVLGCLSLLPPLALLVLSDNVTKLSLVQWLQFVSVDVGLVVTMLAYYLSDQFFTFVREDLAESIELAKDLLDLQQWVAEASATGRGLMIAGGVAILWTAFGTISFSRSQSGFMDLAVVVALLTFGFFLGIGIYYLIWILRLPRRLSRYHYRLFALDPVHSEIVDRLSRPLTRTAYTLALLSACLTLWDASNSTLAWNNAGTILFGWIPLFALFASTQVALAEIVRQGKWQTLNELQARIDSLLTRRTITDSETRETLDWLLTLHDRVKSAPVSAIDLHTALNFLNQLLLPVLAFLLGNLGNLEQLLRRTR